MKGAHLMIGRVFAIAKTVFQQFNRFLGHSLCSQRGSDQFSGLPQFFMIGREVVRQNVQGPFLMNQCGVELGGFHHKLSTGQEALS